MTDVSIIYQINKNSEEDELPFVYKSLDKAIKFCSEKSNDLVTYFTRPSYLDDTEYKEGDPVYIVAVVNSNYEVSFPIIFVNEKLANDYMKETPLTDAYYIIKPSVYVK